MLNALDEFTSSLLEKILVAISNGGRKLVFWGINPTCLKLISILRQDKHEKLILGLIDDNPVQHKTILDIQIYKSKDLRNLNFDAVVITSDKEKEAIIQQYTEVDGRRANLIFAGNANYEFDEPLFYEIVKSCPVKSKAGGYPNMLIHLYQALKYIAKNNINGDVAEFGVYQGGTTVFMAKVLAHYGHTGKIYGFDTFEGFPPPRSVMDMFSDNKCEFFDFETVKRYCSPYHIELIRGDIFSTYMRLRDIPLALSFFDTDNYSPTKQALELCLEQTVQGGILAFDHFYSPNWSQTIGERIAIRQTLQDVGLLNLFGTGIFVKV